MDRRIPAYFFLLALHLARAQSVITTAAGTDWIFPGDGKSAVNAPLGSVEGVAVDRNGAVYFSDVQNNIVCRVDRDGTLRVVAGNGVGGFSGDGGPATNASLLFPSAVAFDAAGNLYIADWGNYRIRKVLRDGTITTFAGNGATAFAGDGGPAMNASMDIMRGLAVAPDNTVYLTDQGNSRVRKIAPNGIISTVAGNGQAGFSGDGGPATQASLHTPTGIALDGAGNLYIADSQNERIRKVTPGGVITTVMGGVGLDSDTYPGYGVKATSASAGGPTGIAVDADGTFYVASQYLVRKVGPDGIVRPVAGVLDNDRYRRDGIPADQASFQPWALVLDPSTRNLYISDRTNDRVYRVGTDNVFTNIAGNNGYRFSPDGNLAVQSFLFEPHGIATDAAGNLYIADSSHSRVRKVNAAGVLTTFAGNGDIEFGGDGGPAIAAGLFSPQFICFNANGELYIADPPRQRVRKVALDGTISTVAGSGDEGFSGDGGQATKAALRNPMGIAVDRAGNLFIADADNHRIRKVTPGGIITAVAGTGVEGFSGDGGLAIRAQINHPAGLSLDASGNLYIADERNHRIRKVTPDGNISSIAGNGRVGDSGDRGAAVNASLSYPADVLVLTDGTIYVADTLNGRVRKVVNGIITTIAGNGDPTATGDGGSPLRAGIGEVRGLAVNTRGNLYISSRNTDRVRVVPAGAPSFTLSPATLSFSVKSGGAVSTAQNIALSSATQGLPFSASANAPWLQVTPASGVLPVNLQVNVDPTGLTAGAVQTTLTITVPNAIPPTRTVSISVTVAPSDPPKLSLEVQALSFSLVQGSGTATQEITLGNRGGGSLSFSATASTISGGNWLTLTPANGVVTPVLPTSLTATVDSTKLSPGTYSGTITVTAGSESIQLLVTLAVGNAQKSILLSQTGLSFTAVALGGAPLPQVIGVLNAGSGPMNWQAKATTLSGGQGWLSITAASGTVATPLLDVSPVDVQVNAAGLAPGDYFGQIEVTAAGADNSPQTISVVLNVLSPGSNPGPEVRASNLIFTGQQGFNPGSQTVMVSNLTAGPISYASARVTQDGANWFVNVPANASITPGQAGRIVVQPDFTHLAPGIYRGAITLLFDDNATSIRNIGILSLVAPNVSAGASKPGGTFATAGCVPKQLFIQMTSLHPGFSVPAFQPAALQARAVDDCGNTLDRGAVQARFSNSDPQVSLVSVGNGLWTGVWQPRDTSQPEVRMAVTAIFVDAPSNLRVIGETLVSGTVRSGAPTPLVSRGAVLNAASFVANAPVAPGALVSIFGSRLANGQNVAEAAPLPKDLGGTQVLIAGRPMPLRYVSDGQLNAQVPYDLPVNTRHQILVKRGSALSVPEDITVAEAQPAVFTKAQSGAGQAIITTPDGTLVEPGKGVRPGDTVIIYCEGLGAVSPAVVEGEAAPLLPAVTKSEVTVTIGGRPAQVLFAGLSPGYVGLYQVNIVVPPGIGSNDAASVVLIVAGQSSPPVTMAVRQ